MDYVTTEFEEYKAPLTGEIIKFNPSSHAFCILKTPSDDEFNDLLKNYASARVEIIWRELLQPLQGNSKNPLLRVFAACHSSRKISKKHSSTYISAYHYNKAAGKGTTLKSFQYLQSVSLKQQKILADKIKPDTPEQARLVLKKSNMFSNDSIGDRFIEDTIKPQKNNFAKVINAAASLINNAANNSKTLHKKQNPRNSLEFLSYLHAQGYILFPYIKKLTEDKFAYWMLHKNNINHCENPELVNPETYAFVNTIREASGATGSEKRLGSAARAMVKSSTFTKVEHTSDELLNRLTELNEENISNNSSSPEQTLRQYGSAFNTYTNMVRDIFNSKHSNSKIKLKHRKYTRNLKRSIDDMVDFSQYSDKMPELKVWTELFSIFCLSINDSQVQVRTSASRHFLDWLSSLEHIPESPLKIIRSLHINDYGEGKTIRNFLKNRSPTKTCNRHLTMYRQFFDFCHDVLYKIPENRESLQRFSNPIDPKWDRFQELSYIGTKRTPIESRVMEELRSLIVEDDYAFPKKAFKFTYAHLTNHKTNEYELNVFCPSIANLLYFMLWIPTRKIQAQLLDSGEGDDLVYDFDKNVLIKNKTKIGNEKGRHEGLLQKLPSGVLGITDVLGLHITTNKTSEDGYDIPWVCDELLGALKNQYQWLNKYAPYPEKRGREALGKIMTKESEETGKKFYCLFRDPSQVTSDDQSIPAATHNISKAWGLLCQEAEKRINEKLPSAHSKVSLTKTSQGMVRSRYDIHTLRVSGITDLLEKGVPLGIVQKFVAGHKTYVMTLYYDNPSHAKVREYLESARSQDNNVSDFNFIESEIGELTDHLVTNQKYDNLSYTAFDALKNNAGIASVKLSGICPGGSCEEGGIDLYRDRSTPVPAGDRGPSCPQCRFWITGPMFLLGQVIEGNQLIRKIKKKVAAIDIIRESIIDAEESGNAPLYNKLSGREDRELRILSNMLTEWSERMKFYEASTNKLDTWIAYKEKKDNSNSDLPISMFSRSTEEEIRYGFSESSDLELTHFISTVSEFLPEFVDSDDTSVPDLEQAIARFMATNDLGDAMFRLNDDQRLHATNLMTEFLINTVGVNDADTILKGEKRLKDFPSLKEEIQHFVQKSEKKLFTLESKTTISLKAEST